MRKVVFATLFCLIASTGYARDITPGTVKVSGSTNAGFSSSKFEVEGEKTDTDIFSIDGDIAVFVTKNLAFGGMIQYEHTKVDFQGVDSSIETLLFGPSLTLEFPMSRILNMFVSGFVGYFTLEEESDGDKHLDADGVGYGGSAGFAIFPINNSHFDNYVYPRVSIDLKATYEKFDGDDDISDLDGKQEDLGARVGLSVYF